MSDQVRRRDDKDIFGEFAAIDDALSDHHDPRSGPRSPPGIAGTGGGGTDVAGDVQAMLATYEAARNNEADITKALRVDTPAIVEPDPLDADQQYEWLLARVGYLDGLRAVQQRLLDNAIDEQLQPTADPDQLAWQRHQVEIHAREALGELVQGVVVPHLGRDRLIDQWVNDIVGLGPAEPLYQDPDVTELVLLGPDRAMVERGGRLEDVQIAFRGHEHLTAVAQRLAARIGRKIDEADPMVDTRLPNGDRANIVFPPTSLHGVVVTIRKHDPRRLTLDALHATGMFNAEMLDLLQMLVVAKVNLVISGPTNSGKTTLARALAGTIPDDEYLVTIEDSAELHLAALHYRTAALEARAANSTGRGAVPIRRVLHNALRMRPNRIIIGEARAEEALDMLQAMNTGHDGSMTTIHANSVEDAILQRIPDLAAQSGEVTPEAALRRTVRVIEAGIHLRQLGRDSRRIIDTISVIIPNNDYTTARIAHLYQWDGTGWVAHDVIDHRVRRKFDAAGFTGHAPSRQHHGPEIAP